MQKADPDDVRAGTEVALENPNRVSLKRLTEAARRPGARAQRVNRLSYEVRESIYRQEPWLLRGVNKQTGDLVKHGFTVILPDAEDSHPDDPLFQAWLRRTRALQIVRQALIAAHVHGDGLVEIEWDDEATDGSQPVPDGAMPVAVYVIDPVSCTFEKNKETDEQFLVQDNFGRPVVLHPDRYHHFFFNRLPGHVHGIATVEVVYHAALSKVKGDQGSGEVVYNAGQPKVHSQTKDPTPGEIEEKTEMINDGDFVRGYATDDRTTITQLNPLALDPKTYYDAWKSSEAAGIGIPVMMLEGAQAGAVTGSETNLVDYHSDQHQVKVNVLDDFFKRMASAVLLADETEFDLKWSEPPMSKQAMAVAARDAATAFGLFRTNGFTPEAAARLSGLEVGQDDFEETGQGPNLPPITESPPGIVPNAIPRPGQPAQPATPAAPAVPAAPATPPTPPTPPR